MTRIENIRHRAVSNPEEESSIDIMYLLYKLEIAEKGLEYISGFHVRGITDKDIQILRDKASEFLLQVRE